MKSDAIRVTAVFENGDTIDNDIIDVKGMTGKQVAETVEEELETTREWWNGSASYFVITHYNNGEITVIEERRQI